MIKEAYVSFETAKLLKEKGFDEECRGFFHTAFESPRLSTWNKDHKNSDYEECVSAPTQQMAMRWLREEKHYYIQIMLDSWALGGHSGYYIVIQDVNSDFSELSPTEQVFFETYEDAVEAALKYCLEEVI